MQQQVQGHTLCRPHDCSECHRSEGHCSGGHCSGCHRSEGHCSGCHCSECHRSECHRSECHRSEGHRSECHRSEGHRSGGHCSGGHCSECHCSGCHCSECHRSGGHRSECHHSECHRSECHHSECHRSECHRSGGHRSECHHSECHRSECHHSECHRSEGHRSEGHRSEGDRTENQRNYSLLDPTKGPCDSCLSPSLSPDLDSHSSCRCGPLSATDGPSKGPCDFSRTLPSEMSEEIFLQLDARSLCRAGQTCRHWRHIIEDSERLWRSQCLLLRAQCHREVERDRGHGLSWKVTLVRNYARSRLKRDWLRGRFSCIQSANELQDVRMVPFDAEAWGEILEAELDR